MVINQNNFRSLFTDSSSLSLIVANLFPIAGVLFFNWGLPQILLLFWTESGIVGFFNILKIICSENSSFSMPKFFLVPFFAFHFGTFMLVHGIFLIAFITQFGGQSLDLSNLWNGIQLNFYLLFLSHGYSFVKNYLINGEWKISNVWQLMNEPYLRIVPMHFALLIGGFITMAFKNNIGVLIILMLGKLVFDLGSHRLQHGKYLVIHEVPNSLKKPDKVISSLAKTLSLVDSVITIFIVIIVSSLIFLNRNYFQSIFQSNLHISENKPSTTTMTGFTLLKNNQYSYSFYYPSNWALEEHGSIGTSVSNNPYNLLDGNITVNVYEETYCFTQPQTGYFSNYEHTKIYIDGNQTDLYKGTIFSGMDNESSQKVIPVDRRGLCYEIMIFDGIDEPNKIITDKILSTFKFTK